MTQIREKWQLAVVAFLFTLVGSRGYFSLANHRVKKGMFALESLQCAHACFYVRVNALHDSEGLRPVNPGVNREQPTTGSTTNSSIKLSPFGPWG